MKPSTSDAVHAHTHMLTHIDCHVLNRERVVLHSLQFTGKNIMSSWPEHVWWEILLYSYNPEIHYTACVQVPLPGDKAAAIIVAQAISDRWQGPWVIKEFDVRKPESIYVDVLEHDSSSIDGIKPCNFSV